MELPFHGEASFMTLPEFTGDKHADPALPPAVKELAEFLQTKPANAEGYCKRGMAFIKIGDGGAAVADFSRVLTLQPNNTAAYLLK
jgi:Flp pilus assembly protein TadD